MLSTKKEKSPSAGLILVVDDNEINRYVTNKILTQCGFEVDLAEDGQIAVDKVATKQYDLILMDLHMPILDGLKATEIIRSYNQGEFSELPIVALTCSISNRDLDQIGKAGLTDYIRKPFVPDHLKEKVRNLLGLHSTCPES
ncbi:response regulator receiver domain-containing protein [Arcticibacter pallidicorallinus]|uniref:Response regulator receiver domain-containing protein n=1 Tax=Arcticibacter pallidicorallinus TaxID=1259464 RepID=A0A2T0U6Y6_9SPHI|nr:response regulator [Arcticibacter pallidicorallinus]PRY53628.1 response regulator receiver domain-containing protein [Arcticibacter pallidicorallinus]